MRYILIITYLLITTILYSYEPIEQIEDLYLRDIPIYYGLEDTKKRLQKNPEPIWVLNLSGGSARAFAHIGVLKRLEEEDLRPDVIITNSMGSIVGLAYAAGMSIADIEDMVKTLKLSEFFDINFPLKGGLIDPHRLEAFMFALFGEMDLSETDIPIFVVTEDLRTKRQIILSKGNLTKVLIASFALPFYFEPVNIENFRLVDGGTSSLVPVSPFINLLPNMVVSSTFYAAEVNLYNPVTVLNVTLDISKSRRSVREIKKFKPFLIRCEVENISFMAFDEGAKIIDKGYGSADKIMSDLINYLDIRDISPNNTALEKLPSTEQIHNNWITLKTRLRQSPLPARETGSSLKPGFEVWHSFGGMHYLNQNNFPVIKTSLWHTRSLMEGMLYYTDDMTGTIMRLNTGVTNSIYINMEGQLNFSSVEDNFLQYTGNYIFAKSGAIIPFLGGFLESGIITEFIDIDDFEKFKFSLRPGMRFKSNSSMLNIDLRYLIRRDNNNDTYGLSAEYIISIPLGDSFRLDTRGYGKSAINNLQTGVELTFNDFYRSRGNAITSTLHNYFPSYLVLNTNIKWNVGKYMASIGEIVTLKDSTLYLFHDLLIADLFTYNGEMRFNHTLGFGVEIIASLIGLKPYVFSLSGGWDIKQKAPFITFNIGTVFS